MQRKEADERPERLHELGGYISPIPKAPDMITQYLPEGVKQAARTFRDSPFKWRYIDNLSPLIKYSVKPKSLSGEGRRVLTDLNRDGIAITTASKLLSDFSVYHELKTEVERIEQRLATELDQARKNAEGVAEHKTFIFNLLGDRPTLNSDDIMVRFALQKELLQMANAYFGMLTHLRFYNVWHTFATQAPARRSQLWHRDPEDHLILKVFVYLSDVDEGAGPFTYAPGTHLKGQIHQEPECFREPNRQAKRSEDDQMAAVVPPERWIKGLGDAGTIIFADTRGYHKGGLARTHDRIMYNCMFTSPASKTKEVFTRPASLSATKLTCEQAFALRLGT